MLHIKHFWMSLLGVMLLAAASAPLSADAIDLNNRPVKAVEIVGLNQVPEKLVRNSIRLQAGDAYSESVVESDIVRMTHLNRFANVSARVKQLEDGSLVVTYVLVEEQLLADVRVVGNKEISDVVLLRAALLRAGDPASPTLITRAEQEMTREYEAKGYFFSSIDYDEKLLKESGVLLFKVREGPRVKVKEIKFEGNESFDSQTIQKRIKTKTQMFIFRKGDLNREVLDFDTTIIRKFYTDEGFLDVKIGRRLDLSDNQKEAVIVFLIEEGPRYTVSKLDIRGNEIFTTEQIAEAMPLRPGGIYSDESVQGSLEGVQNIYFKIGYVRCNVKIQHIFDEGANTVQVLVEITEGQQYRLGSISVVGNTRTKEKVVLRETRDLEPGEVFDGTGVEKSRRRIQASRIFGETRMTLIDNVNEADVIDLLVEVEEQQTGNISFGVGVSSDLGVLGAINLKQQNFDITDTPESISELFTGQAFRGAGQQFNLQLQPGTSNSNYQVSITEPYLFESDYSGSFSAFYLAREREANEESRMGTSFGIGRRFGDVWSGRVNVSIAYIDVSSIEASAPVDVFAVAGGNLDTAVGISINRSTIDSVLFPTRGSMLSLGVQQHGFGLGDFEYTRVGGSFTKYWTVDEDFLGRKSVFKISTEMAYLLPEDEAPTYGRLYAGGHRSFRGFEYRGVGPRGIRADTGAVGSDPVGGDFLFLLGAEYNFPLVDRVLRGVVFVDSGTVQDDFGFDQYRVSVGTGMRIVLPVFIEAPIAIDFGFPILKEDGDEEQLISFDIDLPF